MPAPGLPLFPDLPSARFVGIARLASHADPLREGHNVEYFTMPVRSLLNRVVTKRALPFTWAINPYRGCEFACKYCYARYTHEFMEMRDGLEFEQKIYAKQQAAWLLRQELKQVKPGESIAIGTATDPYQPAERQYEITRSILEEFAQHRGFQIGLVTKSDLIVRDIDIFREIRRHNHVHISLTVTTVNTQLARILEPRAPRPDLRLEAVRKLNKAGIDAGINCAPVLPGITDAPEDLDALIKAAKEAGATSLFANPLFLKPCAAAIFFPFLELEFPHLAAGYRKRYANRAFLPASYSKRLSQLVAALRRKHNFPNRRERPHATEDTYPLLADQLNLF